MNIAPNRTKPTARHLAMTVISLTGVAVVAACASSTNSSSGSSASVTPAAGSASSAVPCAQIAGLRSTLTDLSHTSVSLGSAPRIAADLAKAEQELNALKNQAGPFAAPANQLSSELNQIKANASALAQSPSPSNVTKLQNSLSSFKSTAQPLIKEMQTVCP